ncbi:phage SPbeta hypothetical protein [Bacillus atrophaeus UCMB-5137]|nr:phage SPbeta hypothetical protein [Bacillus atrophaeus UCMB-5137]
MDILVSEAMSLNKELKFQLYEDGYVRELIGRVQYLTMNDTIGVAYND